MDGASFLFFPKMKKSNFFFIFSKIVDIIKVYLELEANKNKTGPLQFLKPKKSPNKNYKNEFK